MNKARRRTVKPDMQESAASPQTQLKFFFVSHEEAAAQTDRSSELLHYQDPGDQARRRRA